MLLIQEMPPNVNGATHSFSTKAPMAVIGHNRGPELIDGETKGRRLTLRTRWAKALFDDPDTPTYVIAMAWVIHWYSDKDGRGAVITNDRFAEICNLSRPTITKGKEWLRQHGYVTLTVGDGRTVKTTFQLAIPGDEEGETTLPLSSTDNPEKGETSLPATALPLSEKGETSLPPYSGNNNNIYNNNQQVTLAARARDAASKAKALCDELLAESHPVMNAQKDYQLQDINVLSAWLHLGADPEIHIKPTVRRLVKAKGGAAGSIVSWKWFDKAVKDSMATTQQVLSAAPPAPAAATPQRTYQTAREQRLGDVLATRKAIENLKRKEGGQ
jgi:hypothetical protein